MVHVKLVLAMIVTLAGSYGVRAMAQSGPSSDARARMEQMRQESDQRMQEMRARMDADVGNMQTASRSSQSQESTMDKLRPYRRTIRWGIGLLVVGGIAVWKTMSGRKSE